MKKTQDIIALENKYNITIDICNDSKYGFKGKVSKVETKTTKSGYKFNTYKWLFTFDTFSKASFIRELKEQLKSSI